MSSQLVLLGFSALLALLTCHATAFPAILSGGDDGPLSVLIDPEDLAAEAVGDDYLSMSPVMMKRFFTNHPSDYNPMRRPGPLPRGSKRDEQSGGATPYHPVPRVVSIRQGHGHGEDENGADDGYMENGRRTKKQTRAATLIFRLGSLGMRRKPTVPPGPTA